MTLSLNRLQEVKDKFLNLNYNKMIPPPQQMEYCRMTLWEVQLLSLNLDQSVAWGLTLSHQYSQIFMVLLSWWPY